MKKILILFFALFLLQSCDSDEEGLCFFGSGISSEFPITVDSFNEIALFGPVDLQFRQGTEQSVMVTAEEEIFEFVTYEVKDGLLEIGIKENISCFNTNVGVLIDVIVPDLEGIFIVGGSNVNTLGNINFDKLEIQSIGVANVLLKGSVEEVIYDVSGEITVGNYELETEISRIQITGLGDLNVKCDSLLEINASGSVTVRYRGNPQISQRGSGSIVVLNGN